MSKLTGAIPPQAFELIRDRIGDILVDEFTAQYDMDYGTGEELNVLITIEQKYSVDKEEVSQVNISLARGTNDKKQATASGYSFIYYLDCYTTCKSKSDGTNEAGIKLARLMGRVRYILENQAYKTLGFAPPFITRTTVSEFNIADTNTQDALFTGMGRLTFTVEANEPSELGPVTLLDGMTTRVKMGSSDVGYKYQIG